MPGTETERKKLSGKERQATPKLRRSVEANTRAYVEGKEAARNKTHFKGPLTTKLNKPRPSSPDPQIKWRDPQQLLPRKK